MKGWRKIGLVILVNTSAAVVPAVLMTAFRHGSTARDVWQYLKFALVFAYCIGTLAFVVMDRLATPIFRLRRVFRFAVYWVALAVVAIVGSLAASLILLALGWVHAAEFWPEYRFSLWTAIIITIAIGTIVSGFEAMSQRLQAATLELRTRQLAEERARQAASEARLSSLESRIHPHFLFNTLNSISALIREDPARAERTVERLAALLRYSLDTNTRGLVPLRQEMHIVRDYLEIEKTRFGDRLRYAVDVPAEIEDLEVPPLAVQTLVENSIKHAVSGSRHGGEIGVTARLAAEGLLLEVSDDGPGFDLRALKPGHGLENLRDRLTALFAGAGRLEMARGAGRMVVRVAVPQKKVLV
ncbi:MAG: histidine kinase [Acidobacteriia bacterium]|nr:histidine kinase [Terriglobia bacterium]